MIAGASAFEIDKDQIDESAAEIEERREFFANAIMDSCNDNHDELDELEAECLMDGMDAGLMDLGCMFVP